MEKCCLAAAVSMLFEGEGTVVAYRKKNNEFYPQIHLASSDLDVLERWFSWCVDLGLKPSMSGKGHRPKGASGSGLRADGTPYKTIYKCTICGWGSLELAHEIMKPWLGQRRLARIEEVLALETPTQKRRRQQRTINKKQRESRAQDPRKYKLSPEGREKLSKLAKQRHASGQLGGSKFGKLGGRPTGS